MKKIIAREVIILLSTVSVILIIWAGLFLREYYLSSTTEKIYSKKEKLYEEISSLKNSDSYIKYEKAADIIKTLKNDTISALLEKPLNQNNNYYKLIRKKLLKRYQDSLVSCEKNKAKTKNVIFGPCFMLQIIEEDIFNMDDYINYQTLNIGKSKYYWDNIKIKKLRAKAYELRIEYYKYLFKLETFEYERILEVCIYILCLTLYPIRLSYKGLKWAISILKKE